MKAIKKEIVNSAMATTPIMEIDPNKISTVSSSKDKIILPYSGAEMATISFNIQPGRFEKIHLSATIDGHTQRLTVSGNGLHKHGASCNTDAIEDAIQKRPGAIPTFCLPDIA